MTLYQIVKSLEGIALTSPFIRSVGEGSIYDFMNGNGHIKYGVFFISQREHRQDEIFDYWSFNIFVCDRLQDDLEANRLHIQSTSKEVLANTILTFEKQFYGVSHNELVFHPFQEKFADLTAGVYCQVTFKVPKALVCPDIYEDKYGEDYRLQELEVSITSDGVFEYTPDPDDYDGYKSVKVTVNVPQTGYTQEDLDNAYASGETAGYNSGKTDGITEQKNKLISTAITDNGTYTREDGYSSVVVSIDTASTYNSGYTSGYTDGYNTGFTEGYNSGETDGMAEQKAKLVSTAITHNGEYVREDGYSAITVNVDTGATVYNQVKSISISANTSTTITYDSGYTGLEQVSINVDVPQTGYTQQDLDDAYASGQTDGYNSGYTEGYNSGETAGYNSGYTSGETHQKSLLTSTAFTDNGIYTRENGYSAVTVNVAQTGYTQQDLDNAYASGETDGVTEQKGKLVSTAITENGTYTKADGYSAITVNVPVPQSVIDNIYNRAYNDGSSICKYSDSYLTFEILESGNIVWSKTSSGSESKTIYYSKNNGSTWSAITSTTNGVTIPVNSGDTVMFKGDNTSYDGSTFYGTYVQFNVYGNIMSLINSTGFTSLTTLPSVSTFHNLFWETDVVSAENLILPATTLTQNCYAFMFKNCQYLTTAPALLATTLVNGCYDDMFYRCTSLNYVRCLTTTDSSQTTDYMHSWLYNVASSGTFVKKAGSNWQTGATGIPNNWTIINVN